MVDDPRPDEAKADPRPAEGGGRAETGDVGVADTGATGSTEAEPAPRPSDPWKGLRGVMAGTLILEAIVAGLALPVIAKLGGGISTAGGIVVIVLAVAMVVAAFLLRTGWGLPLALVLQGVMIVCGLFQFTLGVLGVMFAMIWAYILYLRRDLIRHLDSGSDKYTGGGPA